MSVISPNESIGIHVLLADDDIDDCDFFKEALDEIDCPVTLTRVSNGVELMVFLMKDQEIHPDLIFLDLNMPKKSGIECLLEIKAMEEFIHTPIIVYSTSLDGSIVNYLYDLGAYQYIQKPGDFTKLKIVIEKAIFRIIGNSKATYSRDNFIIRP